MILEENEPTHDGIPGWIFDDPEPTYDGPEGDESSTVEQTITSELMWTNQKVAWSTRRPPFRTRIEVISKHWVNENEHGTNPPWKIPKRSHCRKWRSSTPVFMPLPKRRSTAIHHFTVLLEKSAARYHRGIRKILRLLENEPDALVRAGKAYQKNDQKKSAEAFRKAEETSFS